MFTKFRNLYRHLGVFILSLLLMLPCTYATNKSYYKSIANVNYWEEKQVVSLLKYILNNTEKTTIAKSLEGSLSDIRFLEVKIKDNSGILIIKPIEGYDTDYSSTNEYKVSDYTISISRRIYPTSVDDYTRYIKSFYDSDHSFFTNRNIMLALWNVVIFLFLEVLLFSMSIRYRMSRLSASIR